MNPANQTHGGERGQAMVEFAIVVFLFLILLFAVCELSRLVLAYSTVSNAARVGARAAIVRSASCGDSGELGNLVRDYAAAATLKPDRVSVQVVCAPDNHPGSRVTVTVSYPYDPFTMIPIGSVSSALGAVTLSASSQGVITF